MVDAKSRARVVRLLGDNFRPDDIGNLFLFARERCDGRQSVTDIGDFVAHHNERNKGVITDHVRGWATTARFFLETFTPNGPRRPHARFRMPSYLPRFLRASVTNIGPRHIRQKTGMSQVEAQSIIEKVLERVTKNEDGSWAIPAELTPREESVLACVMSVMVVKPVFTAEKLCDDFRSTLKSNGLISKEELRTHTARLDTIVQLFAISIMHKSEIVLEDGSRIVLKAHIEEDSISVGAAVPVDLQNPKKFFVNANIFQSKLEPSDFCDAFLLENLNWEFDIELNPGMKIAPLFP